MTSQENAFLYDLRRIMREHRVRLMITEQTDDATYGFQEGAFVGPEVNLEVDSNLQNELQYAQKDQA